MNKSNNKKNKVIILALCVLWGLFCTIILVLSLAERWLIYTYGLLSADKIVYHINAPLEGANMDVAWKFALLYLLPGMIVLFAIVFFAVRFRKK